MKSKTDFDSCQVCGLPFSARDDGSPIYTQMMKIQKSGIPLSVLMHRECREKIEVDERDKNKKVVKTKVVIEPEVIVVDTEIAQGSLGI